MTDPVTATLAGISMAASVGGGILGAEGAAKKDDATTAMYNYKAGVAQANAAIAKQNAAYEQNVAQVTAEDIGLKGAQDIGEMKAKYAAGNLSLGPGNSTAQAIRSEGAGIQTAEANAIGAGARRGFGYQVQGMNFTAEGVLDTSAAGFTQEQKGFDVAQSVLGGAGSFADKWFKFKQAGVFDSGGGEPPTLGA